MIDTKEIRKALAIHGVDVLNVDEVLDVLDHLEAAYKEIESWKGVAKQFGNDADTLRTHLSFAKDELNRLRAKIERMEQQKPVASVWRCDNGHIHGSCERTLPMGTKLYALPGAQKAPNLSVDLITDYLVSISSHVAHQDDPKAQAEIGELLRRLTAVLEIPV